MYGFVKRYVSAVCVAMIMAVAFMSLWVERNGLVRVAYRLVESKEIHLLIIGVLLLIIGVVTAVTHVMGISIKSAFKIGVATTPILILAEIVKIASEHSRVVNTLLVISCIVSLMLCGILIWKFVKRIEEEIKADGKSN